MKVIKAQAVILTEIDGEQELKRIEQIARVCYKSEDRITKKSSHTLIKSLIENGHEAMLEHSSLAVKFIVDRGISHELVRHRIASFAQESTRYCNYSKEKFGNSITFIDIENGLKLDTKIKNMQTIEIWEILTEWRQAMKDAEKHYLSLIEMGATPQMARSVLPNSLKTEIVVTANYREWRNIFKLRTDKPAHPQMREVMIPLLKELKTNIPVIFDDIEIEEV